MLIRPTLNARQPRTMRDTSRDAFDWIEHHRAPLSDRLLRWWRVAAQLLFVVLLFGGAGVLAFNYLSR